MWRKSDKAMTQLSVIHIIFMCDCRVFGCTLIKIDHSAMRIRTAIRSLEASCRQTSSEEQNCKLHETEKIFTPNTLH